MNFAAIGRMMVGPGGAPYSRHHINEVLHGRRRCSRSLAEQLVDAGVITSRRHLHVSAY